MPVSEMFVCIVLVAVAVGCWGLSITSIYHTMVYLLSYRWGHRVPPAGLPIEQVLGEYSLSFPS